MSTSAARREAIRNQTSIALLPWEQCDGESAAQFEAFARYRDMGADRSVRKIADKRKDIYSWSKLWNWEVRALAYDRDQDRAWRVTQETARREMAKRHAQVASAMLMKVASRLASIDPETLTPRDLAQWVETAVKIERISRGEPDQSVRISSEGMQEIDQMTPQERREMIAAAVREANVRLLNPALGVDVDAG